MLDLAHHFRRFLAADPERLHMAAHSHHLWPDVTREAQLKAWDDAARLVDRKWGEVLGPVLAAARRHVARILALPDPATVTFAPNTHEFVLRLLSCLPAHRPARILTTDGEFHSFRRQTERLAEDGLVSLEIVPVEPFASFADRFVAAAAAGGHDLVFFSQVFFGSGFVVADLARLVSAVPDAATLVAVDGYHGFLAVPTDLAPIAHRAFYLAGGYKYAMAGEGACFLHAPPGYGARPRDTGWFAAFGALEAAPSGGVAPGGGVAYAADGWRFMGATFDPSGLYRFVAALDWLEREGITVDAIHAHSHALQARFVAALDRVAGAPLARDQLVVPTEEPRRGNFLTFALPDATALAGRLAAAKVMVDVRGERLRVGFGLYHAERDIARFVERLRHLAGAAGELASA